MINHRRRGAPFYTLRLFCALALLASVSISAVGANKITGSVRNRTRAEPAAGDEVILVRLDSSMRQEARGKTDSQGAFSLNVQYSDKPYLVRVVHQSVSYDQQTSAGDTLSINVFDAAPQVRGVSGSIEILRAGTNGNLLHVSDLYEIKNESSPPLTQAGKHTFEVYLPANAKMDSVLAAGPGKVGVMITAAAVPGEPGHYTVDFPLRPGATKFAFNYDVPYDGRAAFQTRHEYPLQQFAVMFPSTMKLSSRTSAFEVLPTGNSQYQVQTAKLLKAGDGPQFELSGTGALPLLGDQAKSQVTSRSPAVLNPTGSARGRANLPSLASDHSRLQQFQSSSQPLVLDVLSALILVSCGLLILRARKTRSAPGAKPALSQTGQTQQSTTLLESLKKELFQIEVDRMRGSISGEEYASTKQALEQTLKSVADKSG